MMKYYKAYFMQAVALCFKPWLKPEEAMLYCDLHRVQFLKKCSQFGIRKNSSGYYSRGELDKMLSGDFVSLTQRWDDLLNGANGEKQE